MKFSDYKKAVPAAQRGVWICLLLIAPQLGWAAGTPSGTTISNLATVTYVVGASPVINATSNTLLFLVDNKVDVTVAKVSDATVIPGTAKQALAFTVTNNGNTTQSYALSVVAGASTLTNPIASTSIFLDVNGDGAWDLGDTLYANPTTFGDVPANSSLKVLIVADIPSPQGSGQTAVYSLLATTWNAGGGAITTAGGANGAMTVENAFADIAGTAAGDVANDGKHSASATYLVGGVNLVLTKTSSVVDPNGGTVVMPNAVITYQITAKLTGSGTATNLVVTDPLPPEVTYVAGSITLDGVSQTDAVDPPTDNTDFGITTANTVTVSLGNVAAPATHVITFRATIN